MYKSLLSWCTHPIFIQRLTGRTVSGDKKAVQEIATSGYITEEVVIITDKAGNEYVSRTQLYVIPDQQILLSDFVSYETPKVFREVKKVSKYRDGGDQTISLQVVYL